MGRWWGGKGWSWGIAVVLVGTGEAAMGCPSGAPTAPTAERRTYQHPLPSFSFEIPANYRAMGTRLGTVEFHDPATFAYIQCQVGAGRLFQRPRGTELQVRPPLAAGSLQAAVEQLQPWLSLYQPRYQVLQVGATEVLRYRYAHPFYGSQQDTLAFFADGSVVILSAPEGTPVLELVLDSLQL